MSHESLAPLRTEFYPSIEPFSTDRLPLDDRHSMYLEQSGNPHGVPVLFLHGGPGAGASASHRQFFDPAYYRIVIFDQRGAGRSTPHGDTVDNTTPHLIDDIEKLRVHLGIERWIVFGGSWGSTLALAYAEHHPHRVMALVLRGIFLARQEEIAWFLRGLRQFFPDAWSRFIAPLSVAALASPPEWREILQRYHQLLSHPDPAIHIPAARTWSMYEGACSTLIPNPQVVANFGSDRVAIGLARIEAHYFVHDCFLPDNFLLSNIGRIRHIPTVIVQGRYDAVCPIRSAHELSEAFPEAQYHVVDAAGHSAFEPGIRARLIASMEQLKQRFGTH